MLAWVINRPGGWKGGREKCRKNGCGWVFFIMPRRKSSAAFFSIAFVGCCTRGQKSWLEK